MSAAARTPGPWRLQGTTVMSALGDTEIAEILVDEDFDEEGNLTGASLADARLIIFAPELLAALSHLVVMARTSGGTAGPDAGLMAACERAQALIAEAIGSEA